jgi:hypothetical protein
MIGVALVIALEKMWRYGEVLARLVGAAALVYAVLVGIEPSLAPGLDPSVMMSDAPMPADGTDPMDMSP